jgi:outer membrane lipoprotein
MEELSPNAGFKTVIRDPAASVGKKVLWGGEIIETKTHEEFTLIEVIQKPLGFKERPSRADESSGRFLVEYRGQFLDPAIYKAGREITIVGEIIRAEKKKLGQMNYRYPYVRTSYVHLWPARPKYVRAPYPLPRYYCDPFWRDCRYPFAPYYADLYFRPNLFFRRPFGLWPNRSPYFFRDSWKPAPKENSK